MAAPVASRIQNHLVRPWLLNAANSITATAINHNPKPQLSENAVSAKPRGAVSEMMVYSSRKPATAASCQCAIRFISVSVRSRSIFSGEKTRDANDGNPSSACVFTKISFPDNLRAPGILPVGLWMSRLAKRYLKFPSFTETGTIEPWSRLARTVPFSANCLRAPECTPGILYEYQNKGDAKFAFVSV